MGAPPQLWHDHPQRAARRGGVLQAARLRRRGPALRRKHDLACQDDQTRSGKETNESRNWRQGAEFHPAGRRRRQGFAEGAEGQDGRALFLSQGRHLWLHGGGLRFSRFAARLLQGEGVHYRHLARLGREPRQVQEEIRPYLPARLRRKRQGLRGLRHLDGEEHVWEEIHGRRAFTLPDRRQGRDPRHLAEGEGAGPRRGGTEGGGGAEVTPCLRKRLHAPELKSTVLVNTIV